ncbi:MAG: hypothetical protein QOE83_990 [Actinomycetota bacterium]|jgi:hypothetical protein|nr:hypothetical protein [Actinomycetota bacterium]
MNIHERTQGALSERMDGEYLAAGAANEAETHLASCSACRSFSDRSARVRTAVRIRPAEPIPDLTEPIMAAIEDASGNRGFRRPPRGRWLQGPKLTRRRLGPIAAALVVGLVAGSVAVGGPWQSPSSGSVAAAAVVRNVQAAAPTISSYQAQFSIIERGLSPVVPQRHLTMDVAFLAPGRFRIDVHDRTVYPSNVWTPTDLTYIADGISTFTTGPSGCPSQLPPDVCPPTRATISRPTRFDVGAPLAADLILPVTTLSSSQGVRVLGDGDLSGQGPVEVELNFARAAPMLPFLALGGTWRPFFAGDRVVLTLDGTDWIPRGVTVYPSTSPDRRAWELRFGLPVEAPSEPILDVQATAFDRRPPAASRFVIPGDGTPRSTSLAHLSEDVGYVPVTPTQTLGLRLTSAVAPPLPGPAVPTSLLTYTKGLSYVVVGQRTGAGASALLGSADSGARQITLPDGGIAYVSAATGDHGNVVSLHTPVTDLTVESDLPMTQLLSIVASIPLRGQAAAAAPRAASP